MLRISLSDLQRFYSEHILKNKDSLLGAIQRKKKKQQNPHKQTNTIAKNSRPNQTRKTIKQNKKPQPAPIPPPLPQNHPNRKPKYNPLKTQEIKSMYPNPNVCMR